jgi:broad specificity phosphatase PhoE
VRKKFEIRMFCSAVLCIATFIPSLAVADDTVFFVVRHAEKANVGSDPALSSAGEKRAEQLKDSLKHLNVDAIFHTDFIRSKATAKPLADELHITPETYDDPTQSWVDNVVAARKGKRTLIVGHSDTVNIIVNSLTGKTIPAIGEHFDNLFIVVISDDGKSVVRLKYGDPN